jgi:hypothetical protein
MAWSRIFTDDDIRRIGHWVPDHADPRRRKLLSQILREWTTVDLRSHFSRETPAQERKRRERLARIGKIADRLSAALRELGERDRYILAAQIGVARGQQKFEAIFADKNLDRLNDAQNLVTEIGAAAKQPLSKPGRGQPRNICAYLVLMDIAAIYEWLTNTAPTRIVDRTTHDESGSFGDYAGAIWPFVFGKNSGFSAAMKNWGWAHYKFGEQSPLIANIAMRHPEWGIFERF